MKNLFITALVAVTTLLQLNSLTERLLVKHHKLIISASERGGSNGGIGPECGLK